MCSILHTLQSWCTDTHNVWVRPLLCLCERRIVPNGTSPLDPLERETDRPRPGDHVPLHHDVCLRRKTGNGETGRTPGGPQKRRPRPPLLLLLRRVYASVREFTPSPVTRKKGCDRSGSQGPRATPLHPVVPSTNPVFRSHPTPLPSRTFGRVPRSPETVTLNLRPTTVRVSARVLSRSVYLRHTDRLPRRAP